MDYAEWKSVLQDKVLEQLDYTKELQDDEVEEIINRILADDLATKWMPLKWIKKVKDDIFFSLRRLDVLQTLLDDPGITEIMVNGYENIFVEQDGRVRKTDYRFESKDRLMDVIHQIVAGCNRTVNESVPVVDARLPDGSRVNVVLEPIALNGPIVTIRRFPEVGITMDDLIRNGCISEDAAEFLKKLVMAKYNILISGGTGSGKTTFLNVLSGFIHNEERIITIEDSAELQLQGLDNLIRLETRNKNTEGCCEVTIRDLIRTSLRMRPDRVIVGEVRGAEAVDMLQAMNTGHDGSMSTAHANSAGDLLFRLENMVMMGMDIPLNAIRRQIASGVDIIVHLSRMRDKCRRVEEICEVIGFCENSISLQTLYVFEENRINKEENIEGALKKQGELRRCEKLRKAGMVL